MSEFVAILVNVLSSLDTTESGAFEHALETLDQVLNEIQNKKREPRVTDVIPSFVAIHKKLVDVLAKSENREVLYLIGRILNLSDFIQGEHLPKYIRKLQKDVTLRDMFLLSLFSDHSPISHVRTASEFLNRTINEGGQWSFMYQGTCIVEMMAQFIEETTDYATQANLTQSICTLIYRSQKMTKKVQTRWHMFGFQLEEVKQTPFKEIRQFLNQLNVHFGKVTSIKAEYVYCNNSLLSQSTWMDIGKEIITMYILGEDEELDLLEIEHGWICNIAVLQDCKQVTISFSEADQAPKKLTFRTSSDGLHRLTEHSLYNTFPSKQIATPAPNKSSIAYLKHNHTSGDPPPKVMGNSNAKGYVKKPRMKRRAPPHRFATYRQLVQKYKDPNILVQASMGSEDLDALDFTNGERPKELHRPSPPRLSEIDILPPLATPKLTPETQVDPIEETPVEEDPELTLSIPTQPPKFKPTNELTERVSKLEAKVSTLTSQLESQTRTMISMFKAVDRVFDEAMISWSTAHIETRNKKKKLFGKFNL